MILENSGLLVIAILVCAILTVSLMGDERSASQPASAPSGISIGCINAASQPADAPQLALVADGDESWLSGKPVWEGKSKDVAAKIWIATTEKEFLLRVVVNDDKHENPYHERNLWKGDCIYISIDGRGDDVPGKVQPLEPDDAVYIFALGDQGPECRLAEHGNPAELPVDQSKLLKSIKRDEAAKTTTYDISIPFKSVSTALAQSTGVGIAACIAHKDSDGKDIEWGKIRGDARTPRKLNAFVLPVPEKSFATIAPLRMRLTRPDMSAEATVAIKTADGASIEASLGGQTVRQTIPGGGGIRRYAVRVPYNDVTSAGSVLEIRISGSEMKDGVSARYEISTPRVVMDRFAARVEKLMATAPNVLVREHLTSSLLVVRDAFVRLPLETADHPERADEFLNKVELIMCKMPADVIDWNDHIHKCIPLAMAFVSETDRTLQFYSLQMPYDYQEGKAYPLTVYLHGTGDQNPLGGLITSFDNSGQDTLFRTVEIERADIPPSHRGFVLAPWARGNSMYRGAAERDVWQTVDIVRKKFKIDPDRIYMSGFSMGCSGAMALAGHRPDMFAGVNLASGFGPWSDTSQETVIENIRGMAIAVWIGEQDSMVKGAKTFHELLDKKGMEHRFEIATRLPHTYPYLKYQENIGYLMQYTRRKPEKFSFTADNPEYTGRNGVVMMVGRSIDSNRPSFSCSVSGQEITIDSKNVSALRLDLDGADGFGLTGDVKVIWNGKEAYSGPAKKIEIKN